MLGFKPMPWQVQVAAVVGEYDPATGIPCYRSAVLTPPRQSGKTSWLQGFAMERATMWEPRQRISYSAQHGAAAREKLLEEWLPVFKARVPALLLRPKLTPGFETIRWVNGSRINTEAATLGAGHGSTTHLSLRDEYWADTDERRSQAQEPATSAVADAQTVVSSTAGTSLSLPLRRLVDRGRLRCEDPTTTTAYFEWSAPEDADPDDEATWWGCMPALGYTQTVEAVRHARQVMTDGEFRRAFLNQWWDASDSVIPPAAWASVQYPGSRVGETGVVFAVDATKNLGWGAIVAADRRGRVEVVDTREGVAWLEARVVEVADRHAGTVAIDVGGPVGYLAVRLGDLTWCRHPTRG